MEQPIPYFTSLGMFIIDEIHFSTFTLKDVLGGGGTFAIIGSRMVLGSKESKKCCWVIDIGSDCPDEILKEIKSWNTGGIFRYDQSRKCTRGWNMYGPNDFRAFKYITPKKRIVVPDLEKYPWMLASKSFHLICSPQRCIQLLSELRELSEKKNIESDKAVIVWEPVPDCCKPEYIEDTYKILNCIDILTPNAAECAAFFGEPEPTDKTNCEKIGMIFYKYMTKPNSGIVLRCGSLGSMLIVSGNKQIRWFPAYHKKSDDLQKNKVIDPTGCGNTFVGAFATAFVKSNKDFETACIYATLASGACIEQHGLPKISVDDNGVELWNGLSMEQRAKIYRIENLL